MTEQKIEPALTAEEWAGLPHVDKAYACDVAAHDGEWARVIAVANAALPDSDPRKITREKIAAMREVAYEFGTRADTVNAFADALESYLPPDSP